MRNIILIICIFFIQFGCALKQPRQTQDRVDIAIAINSDRYSLPGAVFRGLDWAESQNGQLTNENGVIFSDDSRFLKKQSWVKENRLWKRLERKWGIYVYGCYGRCQVSYISAVCHGFDTNTDPFVLCVIETNFNYAGAIFRDYLDQYNDIEKAASAYNAGAARYVNGRLRNWKYVRNFMYAYTNALPRGPDGY